jgi:hypothetical protein
MFSQFYQKTRQRREGACWKAATTSGEREEEGGEEEEGEGEGGSGGIQTRGGSQVEEKRDRR